MKYKYKKQLAGGALALSLLIGGSSVFAASPKDLGIKDSQPIYEKQAKNSSASSVGRGSAVGTISAINGSGFTVQVRNLKTKTSSSMDVVTDSSTVFSKNGLKGSFADLAVGQKVVVSGTLDKTTNIITAKKVKITIAKVGTRGVKKTASLPNKKTVQ